MSGISFLVFHEKNMLVSKFPSQSTFFVMQANATALLDTRYTIIVQVTGAWPSDFFLMEHHAT